MYNIRDLFIETCLTTHMGRYYNVKCTPGAWHTSRIRIQCKVSTYSYIWLHCWHVWLCSYSYFKFVLCFYSLTIICKFDGPLFSPSMNVTLTLHSRFVTLRVQHSAYTKVFQQLSYIPCADGFNCHLENKFPSQNHLFLIFYESKL